MASNGHFFGSNPEAVAIPDVQPLAQGGMSADLSIPAAGSLSKAKALVSITTGKSYKPAQTPKRERNRRRAKDFNDRKIREIHADFAIKRNTLEVAQDHLLPRSEAVDGVLITLVDSHHELRGLIQELQTVMEQFGVPTVRQARRFQVVRSVA